MPLHLVQIELGFWHAKRSTRQFISRITFLVNAYLHGEDECRFYRNFHFLWEKVLFPFIHLLSWNNKSRDVIEVVGQITSNSISQLLALHEIEFGVQRVELQKVTSSQTCWNYWNDFSASLGYTQLAGSEKRLLFRALPHPSAPAPAASCSCRAEPCGAPLTLPTRCNHQPRKRVLSRTGKRGRASLLNQKGMKLLCQTKGVLFP